MGDDYEPETVLISLPAWNSMVSRNHELQARIKQLESHITTDNTAVIAALEKRVDELEKCGEHRQDIIEILEGRVEELQATVEELRSARKDWEHQKWLLEMELGGYRALSEAQGFIIDELKVAGLHK